MLGEITGLGGVALRGRDRDSEGIALLDGTLTRGTVLIAFERNHRIVRYPIRDGAVERPTGGLKLPAEAKRMPNNQGIEALTVNPTFSTR